MGTTRLLCSSMVGTYIVFSRLWVPSPALTKKGTMNFCWRWDSFLHGHGPGWMPELLVPVLFHNVHISFFWCPELVWKSSLKRTRMNTTGSTSGDADTTKKIIQWAFLFSSNLNGFSLCCLLFLSWMCQSSLHGKQENQF